MVEPKLQGKSHDIPKRLIWDAWLKVKKNGGAAGPHPVATWVRPVRRAGHAAWLGSHLVTEVCPCGMVCGASAGPAGSQTFSPWSDLG